MNTPKTAADVKPGDIVLRRLANYRPYEVESIEADGDDRVFTWKPLGCAKFYRGDRYRADDGILVVEEG